MDSGPAPSGASRNDDSGQFTWRSLPAQYGSRKFRRRILPEGLRGSASRKSTDFGVLKPAIRSRVKLMMSDEVALLPGFITTTALTASPHLSSGMPITAASATSGWSHSALSTSAG